MLRSFISHRHTQTDTDIFFPFLRTTFSEEKQSSLTGIMTFPFLYTLSFIGYIIYTIDIVEDDLAKDLHTKLIKTLR